jgi:hypothetical protein
MRKATGEMNMWSALFTLTNVVAFGGWAALAVLPRTNKLRQAVLYGAVGLLCLAYVAMFVALFGGLADPHRMAGAGAPDVTDYSVAGLRPFFMSDGGIVLGWTHYLAFDLFVGLWIARDADRRGASRLAQLPFLFAALMAGPIGLFAWLAARNIWRRG